MQIDISYMIIIGVFFIVGFLVAYSKKENNKNQEPSKNTINNNNNDIIEMIEARKQEQMDYFGEKINELHIRLEIIEVKLGPVLSKSSTDKVAIPGNKRVEIIATNISQAKEKSQESHTNLVSNHKSTIYHILKILVNKSLTSNEIMIVINRTREHTSRLMKKLYNDRLVERDDNNKPFRYKITELGNQYLNQNDFNNAD